MIKFYKSGDSMGIETDCSTTESFVSQFSELLADLIENEAYKNDWEFQLSYWLPQFAVVCSSLGGIAPRFNKVRTEKVVSLKVGEIETKTLCAQWPKKPEEQETENE